MVKTASTMALPLGATVPDFRLRDTAGRLISPDQFRGTPGLLVIFMCNHCPFVKHIAEGLTSFTRTFMGRGLSIVGINSNDTAAHPEDDRDHMRLEKQRLGYAFPYCLDETQTVAKAFRAACTPNFFLFDKDRKLVYRGQFDGSRPGNDVKVTGDDLRKACDAVLAGRPVRGHMRPSIGCNIKWKPGNEPDWFGG